MTGCGDLRSKEILPGPPPIFFIFFHDGLAKTAKFCYGGDAARNRNKKSQAASSMLMNGLSLSLKKKSFTSRHASNNYFKMRAHLCLAKCYDDSKSTQDQVHACSSRCSQDVETFQHNMQQEINMVQQRLERCAMACQDSIRDQVRDLKNLLRPLNGAPASHSPHPVL